MQTGKIPALNAIVACRVSPFARKPNTTPANPYKTTGTSTKPISEKKNKHRREKKHPENLTSRCPVEPRKSSANFFTTPRVTMKSKASGIMRGSDLCNHAMIPSAALWARNASVPRKFSKYFVMSSGSYVNQIEKK
jgi:hypothetical protein